MKEFSYQDREQIRDNYVMWSPRSDPYGFFPDWVDHFSPIEKALWSEIRLFGLPLYPQFPVNEYFLDFADPEKKIALEADGKEFHQDKKADQKRQQEIEALGWIVYRITGDKIFRQETFYSKLDLSQMSEYELQQALLWGVFKKSDEILRAIKILHYAN